MLHAPKHKRAGRRHQRARLVLKRDSRMINEIDARLSPLKPCRTRTSRPRSAAMRPASLSGDDLYQVPSVSLAEEARRSYCDVVVAVV
jgi:hypothetical protein